jgi:hypothetical protein
MNREMLLPLLQAELNRALGEIERLTKERDAAIREIGPAFAEIEWLRAEMEERSRIIGMSREREARHLAEIKKLKEDVHLANGVADLAIKHRDAAEADVVARQALVTRLTQESNMHARACAKVFDELQEVKHERDQIIEMCAKVCDARQAEHRNNYRGRIGDQTKIAETKSCASAIRALKEER